MTHTTDLTPAELSAEAIIRIKEIPSSHAQIVWHNSIRFDSDVHPYVHPCGTAHCWAGHIDLIIGVPAHHTKPSLYNNVQACVGLTDLDWQQIVDGDNSVARLEALHKKFFVDGVFGNDGWDKDGFNEDGIDENGFDAYMSDKDGSDEDGDDEDGLDERESR